MVAALSALIPSLVMAALFVALLVTAARATDWSGRKRSGQPSPSEGEDSPGPAKE